MVSPASEIVVGLSGVRQNAAVAVSVNGRVRAVCEQERVTRVRNAALVPGALPMEALEAALASAGASTAPITTFAAAESAIVLPPQANAVRLDHHRAHAATAFYLSGAPESAILVCDHHSPEPDTRWTGAAGRLTRLEWPSVAHGVAPLYSDCAVLFGFAPGQEHELEALARLDAGTEADRFAGAITYRDGALSVSPGWRQVVQDWLSAGRDRLSHRARVAAAFQHHLGRMLVAMAADLRQRTGLRHLCLGGGLFYNTYFNTVLRQSGAFDEVFIAPNPGNAGTAVGAALDVAGDARATGWVSPFLGPEYDTEAIKRTLDNCKLSYECLDEGEAIATAVRALARGHLVGWFQGRMEWGHRALGHRSILASPLSPYVLDNLNVFLKHRQRHRAYGVSVPVERAAECFDGPPASPYMEFEFTPKDPERLRPVMPEGTKSIRVQTIPPDAIGGSPRTRRLHEQFGEATGLPVLVNTSFNGFSEPMVCSPRDAIRVFFGTGLDLLVMDRFVIRK